MRRYILLILTLLTSVAAMAHTPWSQLSSSEREAVLKSRRTPAVVRKVMQSDFQFSSLESATRVELLKCVTSRTSDDNLSALYLYLYDLLRDPSGQNGRQDLRMLSLHVEKFLEAWSAEENHGNLYNYAYSVGSRRAIYGKSSAGGVLKKLSKKRYVEKYQDVISIFNAAVEYAYKSELAGRRAFEDVTPPVKAEDKFLIFSAEEYNAVSGALTPVALSFAEPQNEIEATMRRECMLWSRAYNAYIKHSLGRNIELVQSATSEGEYLTFVDSSDDSYSVENELYQLKSGGFVVVERHAEVQSVMLGRVTPRGVVDIIGRVYIDMGRELVDVKCTDSALYLHVRRGATQEYLQLPLK